MRAALARAVGSSDLEWQEWISGDIERVTAMGLAGGSDTLRARLAHDQSALRRVVYLIAKSANVKSRTLAHKIARQAVLEWLIPHCRHCSGAKEINEDSGLRIVCRACGGSGVHRYPDRARAIALGVLERSIKMGLGARIEKLIDLLTRHEQEMVNGAKNLLTPLG